MSAYQSLGAVTELIQPGQPGFVYPEFAVITPLIHDGVATQNYVLQSSAPDVRRGSFTWIAVEDDDLATIRGYAEDKTPQSFTEEDGTVRSVVVLDPKAEREPGAFTWRVTVTLIETTPPAP